MRPISRFPILFLLIVPATGCQLLHPTPPLDISVRDAETKAPIPDAHVTVWRASLETSPKSGNTGPDGAVKIPAPPTADTPLLYEVVARGYLTRQTDVPAIRTANGGVLEVFAEPRPYVELVLPDGYKGLIRARIRVQPDVQVPFRQRQYAFNVPPSGVVDVILPPIFTRGSTPDIRVRYANGTTLPRTAKDYEIGCRWLQADAENGYIFVIGTQYETDEIRRNIKRGAGAQPTIGRTSSDLGAMR